MKISNEIILAIKSNKKYEKLTNIDVTILEELPKDSIEKPLLDYIQKEQCQN